MGKVRKKVRKTIKEKPFFHDEIITNILIRLPVKSIVRSGTVCRRWRDITLARDFVDLHLKSSIPVILVVKTSEIVSLCNCGIFHRLKSRFVLDKWGKFATSRFMINRFRFYSRDFPYKFQFLFSHDGLIVGRLVVVRRRCHFFGRSGSASESEFIILNPAMPGVECVKITHCDKLWTSHICALYYHPSLKEYVILWKTFKSGDKPQPVRYKLLNLGSNPSLKTITSSFSYTMKVQSFDYFKPVFINNYLYWMLESQQEYEYGGRNDILQFDIISEDFVVMPCPVPLNTECMSHQTHLLNSDGVLSFLVILPSTITIWRLEDRARQLWTSTEYTMSIGIFHCDETFGIIAVVDGMLSFTSKERLFVCNFKEGTVKEYPERKCTGGVLSSFCSHQMSLASLKDCKSELYIDQNGELR